MNYDIIIKFKVTNTSNSGLIEGTYYDKQEADGTIAILRSTLDDLHKHYPAPCNVEIVKVTITEF